MKTRQKTRLLSPRAFGETLEPPRSPHQVKRLRKLGRIPGAIYIEGKGWAYPEGAKVKGGGIRVDYQGVLPGLSVREYARLHGVSESRIYRFLKDGRIEGAKKHKDFGWDIPEDAPYPAEF